MTRFLSWEVKNSHDGGLIVCRGLHDQPTIAKGDRAGVDG